MDNRDDVLYDYDKDVQRIYKVKENSNLYKYFANVRMGLKGESIFVEEGEVLIIGAVPEDEERFYQGLAAQESDYLGNIEVDWEYMRDRFLEGEIFLVNKKGEFEEVEYKEE